MEPLPPAQPGAIPVPAQPGPVTPPRSWRSWLHGEDPRISIAVTLRVALIAAAVILFLWALSDVTLLIFMAILFGAILRGISGWLSRKTRIGPRLALAVVTVTILILSFGLAWWVGPRLVQQGNTLAHDLESWMRQFGTTSVGQAIGGAGGSKASPTSLATPALRVASTTVGSLGEAFVVIVTAIYLALDPMLYVNGVVRLLPLDRRARARQVLLDIGSTLQWWMLGQAIDMITVGVLAAVGLSLLGVPLAIALGILAGLLTFVPYFGTIIAAIIGVAVAVTGGLKMMIWTVIIFLICHAVEGYIVAPLVQRRTVDLPPALTLLSISALGAIYGPVGLILATPVTAALLMLVREAYVSDVLGDRAAEPEEHTAPSGS